MWQDFLEGFRKSYSHQHGRCTFWLPDRRGSRIEVSAATAVLLEQGVALDVQAHMELFQACCTQLPQGLFFHIGHRESDMYTGQHRGRMSVIELSLDRLQPPLATSPALILG